MEKIKIMMNFLYAGLIFSIFALVINTFFYNSNFLFFVALTLTSLFSLILLVEYIKLKDIENNFPKFFRDFYNSLLAGMTVPQALRKCRQNHYGHLTEYVRRFSNMVDWGIPFHQALRRFSEDTKSKFIKNVLSSIEDVSLYGGNLGESFRIVDRSILNIELLKKEKKAQLSIYIISLYAIFFIFLSIIYLLVYQFPSSFLSLEYLPYFRNLLIIESILCGFSIGKISEGSYLGGIKHTLFLLFITSIFIQLWM